MDAINILYENRDVIGVFKESGLATQSSNIRQMDLYSQVQKYLKTTGDKYNSDAYIINRLDQPVSGIVLFAKNKKAASVLTSQLQLGQIEKYYQAFVYGQPQSEEGILINYLKKNGNVAEVFDKPAPDRKKAILEYRVMGSRDKGCELRIKLLTGRFHQIRAQLSKAGFPIVGDRKYGNRETAFTNNNENNNMLYLRALELIFKNPSDGKALVLKCAGFDDIYRK